MIFGVLKDIKEGENRVICTPVEIASIVAAGHTVLVEKDAGKGSGFPDEKNAAAGARICDTAKELWDTCDFLAKVKEIAPSEYGYLKENQMIYCCIHPAGHPEEVQAILDSKCIAITAEDSHRYGSPNCEAAGKQGALFGLESMLTTSQYMAILLPGEVFQDSYQKAKVAPYVLSRTLEDGGTLFAFLVPWSAAAIYSSGVLGISAVQYLPFAFLPLLCPLAAVVCAITGIGVFDAEGKSLRGKTMKRVSD